jgi:hypothetical protein
MTMLTHPTKCVFDCCPSGVCFPFVVDFGQFITKRKKKGKREKPENSIFNKFRHCLWALTCGISRSRGRARLIQRPRHHLRVSVVGPPTSLMPWL